jgi:hypothetical protein
VPVAAPALDLNALKEQLKETKAIGVFSKIALKNQVDDLMKIRQGGVGLVAAAHLCPLGVTAGFLFGPPGAGGGDARCGAPE